jgi:hypothetical protein
MLRHVILLRTYVSEEPLVSIIWMKRISELGTTLAATVGSYRERCSSLSDSNRSND